MLINNVGEARQETTDISVAVSDGVDAIILSHETSVGPFSLEATVLLAKAIAEAENCFDYEVAFQKVRDASMEEGKRANVMDILCTTASQIALDNNVDLFICLTSTGKIARFLAKQHLIQTILACSVNSNVVK
jgi:pyruvate kinase